MEFGYEQGAVDLLANLCELPPLSESGDYRIVRPMTADFWNVQDFVRHHFGAGWAGEIVPAFGSHPVKCFVALDRSNRISGFAGYDCTFRGFFGPTGVAGEHRGKGIGKALLLTSLHAMYDEGYRYAVIGGVEPHNLAFYAKCCGAAPIEGDSRKTYRDLTYCGDKP